MTLFWKELVCHVLLRTVRDPSLIRDLMRQIIRERMNYLADESRGFHEPMMKSIVAMIHHPSWAYTEDEMIHNSRSYRTEIDEGCDGFDRWQRPQGSARWMTEPNPVQHHRVCLRRRVMDELTASWDERRPYNRRDAIWTVFHGGWEEEQIMPEQYSSSDKEDDYDKCEWYQGIHEGRYYLFWHKDSFRQASRFDLWSVKASIDINVIGGRTLENPLGPQQYPYISWDPKYLREVNKEKKHIDDMFHKR